MALVNPNQPIHPAFHERISVKVEGQLPQFVKEDHATFVAFMEAYYEYMEQQGKPYEIIGNLNNYADVDKSTTEFLNYFKKQFGQNIPEAVFANANKPFVLKHLRDFYRTKGSEKAFQFLFRLLYKEEISFYFPGEDMLRTSDGKYGKSQIIRVTDITLSDSVNNLIGKPIVGSVSKARAIVETVRKERVGLAEASTVFLSGTVGIFQKDETIFVGSVETINVSSGGSGYRTPPVVIFTGGGGTNAKATAKLSNGAVSSVTITSGGNGYTSAPTMSFFSETGSGVTATAVLDVLDNTNSFVIGGIVNDISITNAGNNYSKDASILLTGVEQFGVILRVDELTTGSIVSTTINSGGSGYSIGDKLILSQSGGSVDLRTASILVKEVDASGAIIALYIENSGRGYTQLPTVTGSDGSGTDASITLVGKDIGGIKSIKIFNNGFGISSNTSLVLSGSGDGTATGTANVSGYEDSFGAGFTGTRGFLNSDKYIQDSLYYQLFSYSITSGHTIDKWRDVVKRIAHPAGLALFGNFQIISEIDVGKTFSLTNIPQRDRYTIIFHDGDIKPPVVLKVPVDSCAGQIIFEFSPDDDYKTVKLATDPVSDTEDFQTSTLAEATTGSDDYGTVTQSNFFVKPTVCQTYEQDLGIQKLTTLGGFDDYLFARRILIGEDENGDDIFEEFPATRMEHYQMMGGLFEAVTEEDDFGILSDDPNGVTQLRLGPLRRFFNQQKFNKQGGFSQPLRPTNPIDKIKIFNKGSGYTSVPTVTITGGGGTALHSPSNAPDGTGASATAVLGAGSDSDKVISITLNNQGTGYVTLPTVTISGGGGTGATASVIIRRTSGTTIASFKNQQVVNFELFAGVKSQIVTNSTITQYTTGRESNGVINVSLPPPE